MALQAKYMALHTKLFVSSMIAEVILKLTGAWNALSGQPKPVGDGTGCQTDSRL